MEYEIQKPEYDLHNSPKKNNKIIIGFFLFVLFVAIISFSIFQFTNNTKQSDAILSGQKDLVTSVINTSTTNVSDMNDTYLLKYTSNDLDFKIINIEKNEDLVKLKCSVLNKTKNQLTVNIDEMYIDNFEVNATLVDNVIEPEQELDTYIELNSNTIEEYCFDNSKIEIGLSIFDSDLNVSKTYFDNEKTGNNSFNTHDYSCIYDKNNIKIFTKLINHDDFVTLLTYIENNTKEKIKITDAQIELNNNISYPLIDVFVSANKRALVEDSIYAKTHNLTKFTDEQFAFMCDLRDYARIKKIDQISTNLDIMKD